MKIIPISFDSMGTRSMATYVETKDVKIFIDPGVSLAPSRYGLPPHKVEIEKMNRDWEEIVKYALRSDVLVVSHYHYDHHDPNSDLEIYDGKVLLIKHPKENINLSQKQRAAYFLEQIRNRPKKIEFADNKEFSFGNTLIRFSKAVFHGTNPRLGYVIETMVDDGSYRFIHTSDVEGPSIEDQVEFILNNKPNLVFIDGPLSYMLGFRYSRRSLEESVENLMRIIDECPLESLVIDHHLLRELVWRERIKKAVNYGAKKGIKVISVAEYLGKKPNLLEARRKELYGKK
ncbi:hypothetical protein DRN86_03255 [Candidatus Geothermarchaeota archaeon]|nr:MAG: hypothetical protein DRN86_03255 [Candidatus Geothermarchaeota archaeon]